MDNNKIDTGTPALLTQVYALLEKHRSAIGQERVFARLVGLALGELLSYGRHTITQLLMTLGLLEEDWSAWYRLFSHARFPAEQMSAVIVGEIAQETEGQGYLTLGIDGFPVPRSSQKMPGTHWMRGTKTAKFRPGIERGQRFVEGSWLPPLQNGYSRAVPFRCVPAFPPKAVPSAVESRKEWEAGLDILQWTREQLDRQGAQEREIVALLDGSFDTLEFWEGKPARTTLVVRTARNRCLYYLPEKNAHGNRKYGKKAPAPHEWLRKRKGFTRTHITVRGRQRPMRYRVVGPVVRETLPEQPLFLLVIGGGKRPPGSRRKQYKPCFFLVSAVRRDGAWVLPLPIKELLAWLWQRWELEVAHRDMKSGLGLGEKQCWHPLSTITTVQWHVWLYGVLMLAGYRTWRLAPGPMPPGRWRRTPGRWSFNTCWRQIRAELWLQTDFQASWHGSRNNWLEKEPLLAALGNSLLTASRI